MKFLKNLFTRYVIFQAKKLLQQRKPIIIAITGSVGKTTTKEALFHVLSPFFVTYKTEKSFNTPLGVALNICGIKKTGTHIFSWIQILLQVTFCPKPRYEVLILEYGADAPGDIAQLLKIAKPQIGIVTAIKRAHMEKNQFKNIESIEKEKASLLKSLPKTGLALINNDDPRTKKMTSPATTKTIGAQGDIKIGLIKNTTTGIHFPIQVEGKKHSVHTSVLGEFHAFPLSVSLFVAHHLGIPLPQALQKTKDFSLPPGRMNLLDGIRGSTLIDSSYNANPSSMEAALHVLKQFKTSGKKIAVLGTMNELGPYTNQEHRKLGEIAARTADIIVTVGSQSEIIAESARKKGTKNVHSFSDSIQAGKFLRKIIQKNDIILLKGSQNNVRMEWAIKHILQKKSDISQLCRQSAEWKEPEKS